MSAQKAKRGSAGRAGEGPLTCSSASFSSPALNMRASVTMSVSSVITWPWNCSPSSLSSVSASLVVSKEMSPAPWRAVCRRASLMRSSRSPTSDSCDATSFSRPLTSTSRATTLASRMVSLCSRWATIASRLAMAAADAAAPRAMTLLVSMGVVGAPTARDDGRDMILRGARK